MNERERRRIRFAQVEGGGGTTWALDLLEAAEDEMAALRAERDALAERLADARVSDDALTARAYALEAENAVLRAVAEAARALRAAIRPLHDYARGDLVNTKANARAAMAMYDAAKRPEAVSADATVASPSAQADAEIAALRVALRVFGKHAPSCVVGCPVTRCDLCGGLLDLVRNGTGYLNREQFDAVKAGDWYCAACRGSRGASGQRYFWESELPKQPCSCGLDTALASADTAPVASDAPTASQRDAGEGRVRLIPCPHDNLDRMRPSGGEPWWECTDCGTTLIDPSESGDAEIVQLDAQLASLRSVLAPLRALAEKATVGLGGPLVWPLKLSPPAWHRGTNGPDCKQPVRDAMNRTVLTTYHGQVRVWRDGALLEQAVNDPLAEFIVALVNAWPALLNALASEPCDAPKAPEAGDVTDGRAPQSGGLTDGRRADMGETL